MVKRYEATEQEEEEVDWGGGGCCHTEAKAITHLLLKIMKKLNELIISGERDRKTEMEEGTKGQGKGKEPGKGNSMLNRVNACISFCPLVISTSYPSSQKIH